MSFDLFKRNLETNIEGQRFPSEFLQLSHLSGPHIDIPDILVAMPKVTKKDYEDILARLENVPRLLEQEETLLHKGLKIKVTPVKKFLELVPAQFDHILTKQVKNSPLYKPFTKIPTQMKNHKNLQTGLS